MQEFFEYTFAGDGVRMKYARALPAVRGQEFHDYHEIVFFLGGRARFVSRSVQRELPIGSAVFIPRNAYHRFLVEGSDYTRLILSFDDRRAFDFLLAPLGREPILLEAPSEGMAACLSGLIRAACQPMADADKSLYLTSLAVCLLYELQGEAVGLASVPSDHSETVSEALSLIDRIYTRSDATVAGIAATLGISESLLAHTFKREMNISVYRYMMKKRLATARDMIGAGVKITVAAEASGFCDYSCFLRAYKKEYGCLPSAMGKG